MITFVVVVILVVVIIVIPIRIIIVFTIINLTDTVELSFLAVSILLVRGDHCVGDCIIITIVISRRRHRTYNTWPLFRPTLCQYWHREHFSPAKS